MLKIDGVLEEGKLPVKSSEIRKRLKSLVSYLKKLPQSEERDVVADAVLLSKIYYFVLVA